MLLCNPEVHFIYTPQINLWHGAMQAIRQQHHQASIISLAMLKRVITIIEKGKMLAVVSEPDVIMGRLIVQYAIRYEEGKSLLTWPP